jgi:hypothetical protein
MVLPSVPTVAVCRGFLRPPFVQTFVMARTGYEDVDAAVSEVIALFDAEVARSTAPLRQILDANHSGYLSAEMLVVNAERLGGVAGRRLAVARLIVNDVLLAGVSLAADVARSARTLNRLQRHLQASPRRQRSEMRKLSSTTIDETNRKTAAELKDTLGIVGALMFGHRVRVQFGALLIQLRFLLIRYGAFAFSAVLISKGISTGLSALKLSGFWGFTVAVVGALAASALVQQMVNPWLRRRLEKSIWTRSYDLFLLLLLLNSMSAGVGIQMVQLQGSSEGDHAIP